jgi:hypothetical protein
MLKPSDYLNLPEQTVKFVKRLEKLGFDRDRIFGLFVLIGLYAGAPNTQDKLEELFSRLPLILPVDRSKNIDEVVGHIYSGYDNEINEFCYRSGLSNDFFQFREIKIPNLEKSFYIVYFKDEGLLSNKVKSVDKLLDANLLYDTFIVALGKRTVRKETNLLEAFQCGMFQILLHAKMDVNGSMQIAKAINSLMPLHLSRCFYSVVSGQLDYFLGLESGQMALLSLMQEMQQDYAQQMWGFQSSLFFRDGQALAGVDQLSPQQWHDWVLKNAEAFSDMYPQQLLPFSRSSVTLENLPTWGQAVRSFEVCDQYIERVWGYSESKLENIFQMYEYKALMVHVVYSSLTSARELLH